MNAEPAQRLRFFSSDDGSCEALTLLLKG